MNLIVCQHEWVDYCQTRYQASLPTKYWFENAHYPLPRKEGEETVKLWYPDHIVQGVLQTLNLNKLCIDTRKFRKETKILREVYPEYLDLYWEAYFLCKKISSNSFVQKLKDKEFKDRWVSAISKDLNRRYTNPIYRRKILSVLGKIRPLAIEAAKSPEAREKRKESFKMIKHQQGERNSQYGTMWITNGIINKKMLKTDPIPEGYKRGRTL